MAKTIAYGIYIIAMCVSGFVMADTGLNLKNWRYWTMLVCLLTVYACGYIRGGC